MPLFQAKSGSVATAITKDRERVVAYTLPAPPNRRICCRPALQALQTYWLEGVMVGASAQSVAF